MVSVKPTGSVHTSASYTEIDYAPVVGMNYYRLRQADHTGEFTMSDIRSVEIAADPTQTELFSVFPNPATKAEVHLTVNESSATPFHVNVVDWSGKLVQSLTVDGGAYTQLDVSDLASGIYFVSVVTDSRSETLKLIRD
jgi:hypothetical protein